jgi:hypothetical protein
MGTIRESNSQHIAKKQELINKYLGSEKRIIAADSVLSLYGVDILYCLNSG